MTTVFPPWISRRIPPFYSVPLLRQQPTTVPALRQALSKETGNATVVIVAQRVSTIMNADRIIVMDEGKVMGIGTHRELLNTCGTYQEIVRSQLSEEEMSA